MKKVCRIIIVLCWIWFLFCQVIDFNFDFVNCVHKNTICINIDNYEPSKSNDILKILKDVSKKENSFIFGEFTDFISANIIHYSIYSTNVEKIIAIGEHKNKLTNEITAASNYKFTRNIYKLIIPSILCRIDIYDLSNFKSKEMDIPTKYYIEKEKSKEIISLLRSNNLEISIFDLADELVFTKQTWSKSQILMFFFLGFSIFILCVYNSKKIIIYKLNGYSNINVITSELQSTIWCTILSMISFETVLVFLFEIFQNCGIRFFLYSLPSTLLDCVLMIICIIVPSLIVLFINHASNIKGKKNLLSIKIVSFFMIAAAYVLCIYYSNNSITMFKQVKEMKEFKRNFKIEKLYSLCFNESSRDVDNFFKDFNARCEQLYNILYDENKIVFCYIEENDNKRNSPVLIVNKRYINLLLNYKYISEESFKDLKNGKIIFIPSGIDEEQVNQCKISIPEAELRYYYFEKTFPVFSPLPNNWNGYVRKPIILVIDNPVTLGISPLIMMESDSFFVYDQKKSLNDLLVDTATRSIVSNIKSVSELYGEEIENADITLYEFSFNLIFYLLSFVSIAIFYAIIYFDVEKKKIILKYLLGFKDIHILIDFFLECIIICFIYFLIFDMNVRTFILSIMYEIIIIIIFTIVWKRFRTMRICGILKGEEI